jgi:hypothetical protein
MCCGKLQGERKPVFEVVGDHGHETHVFKGWEQVKPGSMNAAEFDDAVGNLVAYLTWMGGAGSAAALPSGCLGAALPGRVGPVRMAAQCRLLEGREVSLLGLFALAQCGCRSALRFVF